MTVLQSPLCLYSSMYILKRKKNLYNRLFWHNQFIQWHACVLTTGSKIPFTVSLLNSFTVDLNRNGDVNTLILSKCLQKTSYSNNGMEGVVIGDAEGWHWTSYFRHHHCFSRIQQWFDEFCDVDLKLVLDVIWNLHVSKSKTKERPLTSHQRTLMNFPLDIKWYRKKK